jgi:hypothetical protein
MGQLVFSRLANIPEGQYSQGLFAFVRFHFLTWQQIGNARRNRTGRFPGVITRPSQKMHYCTAKTKNAEQNAVKRIFQRFDVRCGDGAIECRKNSSTECSWQYCRQCSQWLGWFGEQPSVFTFRDSCDRPDFSAGKEKRDRCMWRKQRPLHAEL